MPTEPELTALWHQNVAVSRASLLSGREKQQCEQILLLPCRGKSLMLNEQNKIVGKYFFLLQTSLLPKIERRADLESDAQNVWRLNPAADKNIVT